jgi:hypothetical protein
MLLVAFYVLFLIAGVVTGVVWIAEKKTGPYWRPMRGIPAVVAGIFVLAVSGYLLISVVLSWLGLA